MSSHKRVKGVSYDSEEDDEDGFMGEDYEGEEGESPLSILTDQVWYCGGMSTEDQGTIHRHQSSKVCLLIKVAVRLEHGTATTKAILGSETPVTDKEIQDALWYYYYDVDKAVAFLQSMLTANEPCSESQPLRKAHLPNP